MMPEPLSLLRAHARLPWSPIYDADGQVLGAELPGLGVEAYLAADAETGWRLELVAPAWPERRVLLPDQLYALPVVLADLLESPCP